MPSKTLLTAIILDMVAGTSMTTAGFLGLKAIPLTVTLSVMAYSFVFSLLVNDLVKFVLVKKTGIRW